MNEAIFRRILDRVRGGAEAEAEKPLRHEDDPKLTVAEVGQPPEKTLYIETAPNPSRDSLLVVTRLGVAAPPICLAPGVTVVDPASFIEATLADLAAYAYAALDNRPHWVEDILDEKIEHLKLCGFQVEIKGIH